MNEYIYNICIYINYIKSTWVGITCVNGNVVKINLVNSENLKKGASINSFDEVHKLEKLAYLDLSLNLLTGTLIVFNVCLYCVFICL